MKAEDVIGPVCGCGECLQARVAEEPQRRDPHTGRLLHGYELRRWCDARNKFRNMARAAVGPKNQARGGGFKKLASTKGNQR